MSSLFVAVHEPRIASHVGGQYRRQPTLDPDRPFLDHGSQTNPPRTVRRINGSAKRPLPDHPHRLMSPIGTKRTCRAELTMSVQEMPAQPVDATQALNLSAGVS